jgi:hypothetical protein
MDDREEDTFRGMDVLNERPRAPRGLLSWTREKKGAKFMVGLGERPSPSSWALAPGNKSLT